MGRTPLKGFSDFKTWLLQGGRTMSTVMAYMSNVRGVVRVLGEDIAKQEAIDSYFATVRAHRSGSYSSIKQAWKYFTVWAKEVKNIDLPSVNELLSPRASHPRSNGSKSLVTSSPPLPLHVQAALYSVIEDGGLKRKTLVTVQWRHVHLNTVANMPRIFVSDPAGGRASWWLPKPAVAVLRDYAQPGEDLSIPLLPLRPGSHQPYPLIALTHEMQQYEPPVRVESPVAEFEPEPEPESKVVEDDGLGAVLGFDADAD